LRTASSSPGSRLPAKSASLRPRAIFCRAARRLGASPFPDLLARVPSGDSLSGPDLLGRIRALADLLSGAGIHEDSRVLVAFSDSLATVLALPALWSLDCVPLLADGSSSRSEIDEMARRLGAGHLLGDGAGLPGGTGTIRLPGLPPIGVRRNRGAGRLLLPRGTVLVRTTSGSTGPPRGVALSASQILADAMNILSSLRIPGEMRGLGVVPLPHAFGFSTLFSPLLFFGQPLVLLEAPVPEQFRSALRRHPSLFFPGVPYLYDLLGRSEISRRLLARLGICVSAGAPLPSATARRFRERSGVPVRNFYGTSECGAISCDRSPGGTAPAGCAGLPFSGVGVFLGGVGGHVGRRGDSRARNGRVIVEGEAVGLGYVERGARPRLFGGRLLTGDLGRVDSRGRLHLLGRLDTLISVGGRKVHPAEVERVLRTAPGVKEVVALGIPDPRRGQVVAAAVESPAGAAPEDLLARCRRRLARYKVPRLLRVFPSLPRTRRGKPDLPGIRALLGGSGSPLGSR
jgi:acyl-CoA synthetase (AMP-forming)/AMP-acid ligase II